MFILVFVYCNNLAIVMSGYSGGPCLLLCLCAVMDHVIVASVYYNDHAIVLFVYCDGSCCCSCVL